MRLLGTRDSDRGRSRMSVAGSSAAASSSRMSSSRMSSSRSSRSPYDSKRDLNYHHRRRSPEYYRTDRSYNDRRAVRSESPLPRKPMRSSRRSLSSPPRHRPPSKRTVSSSRKSLSSVPTRKSKYSQSKRSDSVPNKQSRAKPKLTLSRQTQQQSKPARIKVFSATAPTTNEAGSTSDSSSTPPMIETRGERSSPRTGRGKRERGDKSEPLLTSPRKDPENVMIIFPSSKNKKKESTDEEEKQADALSMIESTITDEEQGFPVPQTYSTYDDRDAVGMGGQDLTYSVMKARPLSNPEPMVNGLLVQLKFNSEVCPWPLRLSLVLAALGMAAASIAPYFLDMLSPLNPASVIISIITFFASFGIIFLEGRFSAVSNPLGCRASVRDGIIRHVNAFKLVWGRGILYLLAGLLQMTQMIIMTYISGGIMVLCGIITVLLGGSASAHLRRLRKSLTDDEHLLSLFAKYDSDMDGCLTPSDFAKFVIALGLDFDDMYTLKAFKAIDKNRDLKISFVDFHKWWSQCNVEGNEVSFMKERELNSYKRMIN